MKNKERYINGYRLVYRPDHPLAMTSENWRGWVYEHRYVYENHYGKPLGGMVIHHIDGDRLNNHPSNLVAMSNSDHARAERIIQGYNAVRAPRFCEDCNKPCTGERCCTCSARRQEKIDWPETGELVRLVSELGYCEVGRMLGVTDNAVRKRIRNHQKKR